MSVKMGKTCTFHRRRKITTKSGTPSKQKTADGKQMQPWWANIGNLRSGNARISRQMFFQKCYFGN